MQKILLDAVDSAIDFHRMMSRPTAWRHDYYPTKKRKIFYNTVYRLEKDGYLEKIEKSGEKRYRATLKGKAKILRFLKIDKKWDGKWRIVVFDIPEKKKKMRNYFRNHLAAIGFRQLQESVWICPYNIADSVEELIALYEAEDYVHYLLVEELDNRAVLMNLFKLSERK